MEKLIHHKYSLLYMYFEIRFLDLFAADPGLTSHMNLNETSIQKWAAWGIKWSWYFLEESAGRDTWLQVWTMIFYKVPNEKVALVLVAVVISSDLRSSVQCSEAAVAAVVSLWAQVFVLFLEARSYVYCYIPQNSSENYKLLFTYLLTQIPHLFLYSSSF